MTELGTLTPPIPARRRCRHSCCGRARGWFASDRSGCERRADFVNPVESEPEPRSSRRGHQRAVSQREGEELPYSA